MSYQNGVVSETINNEKNVEKGTRIVVSLVETQGSGEVEDDFTQNTDFHSAMDHECDTNSYYDLDDSGKNLDFSLDDTQGLSPDRLNANLLRENYVDSTSRVVTSKGSDCSSIESISFEDENREKPNDSLDIKTKPASENNNLNLEEGSIGSALIRGISSTFKIIEKRIGVPKLEKLQDLRELIIGRG
ncbi:hypothetical protein FG386_002414 [Cryptosporidium ryanae]|uniref:uncharacterized protein n=1 Tax=Cryptosporidium ryanae TaxID=515981 RepID=UPI00351A6326|nr:hypothetical protein FG386_002414 [Cryptosporidium ryanae]